MITTLLGFAAGAIVGAFITAFIDEIIDWAKKTMAKISALIKKAQVWIQRLPGAIKQFLYYIENGEFMVKETTRPATQEEINKLKDKMSIKEWDEFNGTGTRVATVDR